MAKDDSLEKMISEQIDGVQDIINVLLNRGKSIGEVISAEFILQETIKNLLKVLVKKLI